VLYAGDKNLQERYDLAIKSAKRMPVRAVRRLADEMCGRYGILLFVLHDFDHSGFSILGTLCKPTRRYVYNNQITVIDLGLRIGGIGGLQPQYPLYAYQ
jgi:hypothetical protein